MATVGDLQDMVNFIRETPDKMNKALALAQIATIQRAQVLAKKNAQKEFIGRHDRRLSGSLMNNIYSGYEKKEDGVPSAYLGVANIPYGAIHEFGSDGLPGGVIKPVKAKKLWIPARANAGRMTPREFINLMKAQPSRYFITDKGAFREDAPTVFTPLFYRVNSVKIPARPYLTPAIEEAYKTFEDTFERFYQKELDK